MTEAPYSGRPPTERQRGESGLAGTAADQGRTVLHEGTAQARHLGRELGHQADEQTRVQKDKAVSGLRSLGDELSGMASGSGQPGLASDLAQTAATTAHDLAGWLDQRDPGRLLDEVRTMARRRPGTFLLGALAAGVVAGRLTRGTVDANRDAKGQRPDATAGSARPGTYRTTDTPIAAGVAADTGSTVPAEPVKVGYSSGPDGDLR
jgi:hypothetical protein